MLKRCLCLLLSVVMLFSLTSCAMAERVISGVCFLFLVATSDDRADKEDIIAFVNEYQEELLTYIQENDYSALENHAIVKSVDVYENEVEFSCGGFGVGSGTSYCGFYYTADNEMSTLWCVPFSAESLVASGDGFAWQEKNGDDQYFTEKICDYFYYYEAAF